MANSTRYLMPWREATAQLRLNALLGSIRGWRLCPGGELGSGCGRAAAFLRCRGRSLGMPPISIQERRDELCRSRSVWRLCRTDLGDDGGGVAFPGRAAPDGRPPL